MLRKKRRYQAHHRQFKLHKQRVRRVHAAARHPFAVPVITILGLGIITGVLLLLINSRPAKIDPNIVIISHDKQQQVVSSKEPNVGALLAKLDLKVNPGDVVEPALSTPIHQDDFRINIYRAVPVQIVDGGQKVFAMSARTNDRSTAEASGVTVYPEDHLTSEPVSDFVSTGDLTEQIVIDRATPVNVNLYGSPVTMRTHAKTVGALLTERKIKLAPQDQVKPDPSTPIAAAGQITVVRNGLSTLTVQEDIPAPTQTVTDSTLAYGTSAVRQQGTAGKKAVTYQINTVNGNEVSRTPIQETIVQQPTPQIVVMGTNLSGIKGDMALAGIAASDYQYADYIISNESGWCPTKWQGEYGGCPAYHGTPTSSGTGYGLCQATPGYKMASAGDDWGTNPVTQLKWCSGYASRYGGWYGAYEHWVAHHNW